MLAEARCHKMQFWCSLYLVGDGFYDCGLAMFDAAHDRDPDDFHALEVELGPKQSPAVAEIRALTPYTSAAAKRARLVAP